MNAEPNELHIRRRQKIQEDKDFTSARVSESARYIGFGLGAASVAFLTSDAAFSRMLISNYKTGVMAAAAFGCLTILLDYFHYILGYMSSEQAGRNSAGDYGYLTGSGLYRSRRWFFWLKQFTAVLGALIFIAVLVLAIFR